MAKRKLARRGRSKEALRGNRWGLRLPQGGDGEIVALTGEDAAQMDDRIEEDLRWAQEAKKISDNRYGFRMYTRDRIGDATCLMTSKWTITRKVYHFGAQEERDQEFLIKTPNGSARENTNKRPSDGRPTYRDLPKLTENEARMRIADWLHTGKEEIRPNRLLWDEVIPDRRFDYRFVEKIAEKYFAEYIMRGEPVKKLMFGKMVTSNPLLWRAPGERRTDGPANSAAGMDSVLSDD